MLIHKIRRFYKFSITVLVLCILNCNESFAQSMNCATATQITLSGGTACVNGSNAGALTDNTLYGGCNTIPVDVVWYTYVTNGSQNTFTITPGTLQNAEIIVYTSGCPPGGFLQSCSTAAGSSPLVFSWGLPPATQVWIGIASTTLNDGTFQFCINSQPPVPGAGNTCSQAIPICDMNNFTKASIIPNSSGQTPNCFTNPTQEDVWYTFTITQSGTLAWQCTPANGAIEFDWCLWDVSAGCPGIEACCNYNYAAGSSLGFGMQSQAGTVPCGYQVVSAIPTQEYCQPIAVTCGQTFAIQISNFDNDNSGFTFSWVGSTCTVGSNAAFTVAPPFVCGPSLTAAITNTSTGDCAAVWNYGDGSATYTGNAPPNHTYNTPGVYAITENIGGACPSSATQFVELLGPLAASVSSTSVNCGNSCVGTATVSNVSGGDGIYTYSWSTGSTANNVSGLCPGIYTVTVSNAKCGSSLTQTVNIAAPPAISISATPVNPNCGATNGSTSVNGSGGTPGYSYSINGGAFSGTTNYTGLGSGSYTLAVQDINGCTTSTVVTLSPTGSTLSATSAVTASVTCNGANTGSGSVNPSGGTPGYTYTWTPGGGNSSSASNLPAGSYTVNITDLNGCTTFTTVTITQPASALSATQSFTAASCGQSNGSASVNASGGTPGYTYTWTPSGGNASTASGLPAANYTCTITDANGCTSVNPFSITNAGGPTVAVVSSNTISCNGGSNGSASVNASGGTPGYTYTWSPSGGNAASAFNLPAGSYTCNVTDAGGCLSNTVIILGEPNAPLTASTSFTAAVCGQNNGSASVSATGGTPGYTYTWTPSGGNGSTASGLPAASYTCAITDANNCTFTATANITNSGGPSATVASSASVACNGGSTGSASVSVTGGTAGYTYTWSPSGGNASNANNLPAGSYTCNVTDANGCLTNTVVTIGQATAFVFSSITSTSVSCNGGNNGTASVTITGGTPTYTYSWAPSGGNTNTASGLSNGNYTCTVTDVNGCSTNTVVTISQPAILGASISSTTNVMCNGASTGVATATVTGGTGPYTYTWSPSGGNSASATNLPAGNYTCTVTDVNGCTKTAVTNINQPFPINLNISSSSNVSCNGGANGSVTVFTTGGTGPYSYTWSPSGGNSTTASNLGAGSYTCSLTDANGCLSSTVAVISEPAALIPAIASSTNLKCNADNTGSATANVSGGTGPYTYAWLPSGGTGSTTTPLAAGSYTCTVTDSKGCTKTTVATITEPAALSPNPSVTPAGCSGGSNGSASVNITGGTSPYIVSWSTIPVQTGTSATGLSAGVYTATITDNNNCVTKQPVIVLDAPPVDSLEMIGTLCMNDSSVVLSAPHGGTSPNDMTAPYQWYGSGTPIPAATGVTYTANQSNANIYSVTWFYHGCRYISTTLLETIYQDISNLPQTNIFTPNGDKINDDFLPFSLSTNATTVTYAQVAAVVEDYELYIYDRWGSLVFKTDQPLDMWNGVETNGKEANAGTYFWMAKYKTKCNSNNGQQSIKGFVQLIR